ncbi:MAG: xanthine dehydrogenase family protein molybdopterin-binding subunit, partial [Pseudomonadota bacterium]|nr:xanthine dehydrogenase family protein molybdopterin-binding subunit [Pseudomonadota bacterium]
MNMIGKPIRREEDFRLLRGRGRYLDDVNVLRQTYGYVFRSPVAHAEILALDTSAASSAPGVIAVLTGDDLETRGLGTLVPSNPGKRSDGSPGFVCAQPLLAQRRVRFVGEPVAFIVADTVDHAKDASELIEIELNPLPVIASVDEALAEGAPAIWPDNPDNEAYCFERGDAVSVQTNFTQAAHIIRHRVCVNRVAGNAIENRGCIGLYDAFEDRYTLRATVQSV